MAVTVDSGLLAYMAEHSGAMHFELRGAGDAAAVAMAQAREAVYKIPHPEEPDSPYTSFTSGITAGPHGPTFWADMADAEVYDDILEATLHAIVVSLEEAGVSGLLSWPEGPGGATLMPTDRDAVEAAWNRIMSPPATPTSEPTLAPGPSIAAGRWPVLRADLSPDAAWMVPDPTFMDDIVAESPGWSQTVLLPTPRESLGGVRGRDGWLYAIGGAGRKGGEVNIVEAYNPQEEAWARLTPMHEARTGPGVACGNDDCIYVIGGIGTETVERYDIDASEWEYARPPSLAIMNEMGASRGADGRIFVLAVNLVSGNTFQCYDAIGDEWMPLAPPTSNYNAGPSLVAVPDGRLLAMTAHGGVIECYDPEADAWTALGQLPRPRLSSMATLGLDGRVYFIGGDGMGPLSHVDVYDATCDSWTEANRLPFPRTGGVAVTADDGKIYVFGGLAGRFAEEDFVGRVDVFTP